MISEADESSTGPAREFMIADPDGNNIEIIHWFRAWDEQSEAELGVPEERGRQLAAGLPGAQRAGSG